MREHTPCDVGAAVRAHLQRISRERGEDHQNVLLRYANERFLFRLSQSTHASQFVLKGAALFTIWNGNPHRATRDIDLLGFGEPGAQAVRRAIADALALEVQEDGVRFDVASLEVGPIREDQEYGGMRAEFVARIKTAVLRLQVDVGFGDVVTPAPELLAFPTLLDFPAPRLRAYPRETVVAEKVEAMVQLGLANSRMKDFFDLAVLSRTFDFDGKLLIRAVLATFARRRTPLPREIPVALTTDFLRDPSKQIQWSGFVRKASIPKPISLEETVGTVRGFVAPLLEAASHERGSLGNWRAGFGWDGP